MSECSGKPDCPDCKKIADMQEPAMVVELEKQDTGDESCMPIEEDEPSLVELLCEETKRRELTPADFPQPSRNKLDVEMSDEDKITVAKAAAKYQRWDTACKILMNLKDRPALWLRKGQKRSTESVPRIVRIFLKKLAR